MTADSTTGTTTDDPNWIPHEHETGTLWIRADCLQYRQHDIPPPCPTCGGIRFWWSALDRTRCMVCDPPKYPGLGPWMMQRAWEARRRTHETL